MTRTPTQWHDERLDAAFAARAGRVSPAPPDLAVAVRAQLAADSRWPGAGFGRVAQMVGLAAAVVVATAVGVGQLNRTEPSAASDPDASGIESMIGGPLNVNQVTIGGTWSTSDEPALEIFRKPGDERPVYWRATTFDRFTLFGWTSTDVMSEARPAGTSILDSTQDAIPAGTKRTESTFRIVPKQSVLEVVFSPIDPVRVDRDTTLTTTGEAGFFQSIAIPPDLPYDVTASIQDFVDTQGGITENRLRAAGAEYSADIFARYTAVPPGAIGTAAKRLLADLQASLKESGRETPFDLATAIVNEFKSPKYVYSTRVAGVCDREPSITECFARHRTGFCEHYASTMAMLLRQAKIPTRLVEGFLPGKLDVATGKETISNANAHAWVEVYFPKIGWYRFDPTGGGVARVDERPEGSI